MYRPQTEESIRLIREVMERSARYTHFSGLSGVLSGIFGLIGCRVTYWISLNVPRDRQITWLAVTWCSVLVLALAEDAMLGHANALGSGKTIWSPATYQVLKAAFPGLLIFAAFTLLAIRLAVEVRLQWLIIIPGTWAVAYGVALCSAGMFSLKELRIYGYVQIATGAFGLWFSQWPYCLYQLALSFGVYQILFGLWLAGKYRQ